MPPTILITGAGSGFGKGTALELACKGHKVIATEKKPKALGSDSLNQHVVGK